MSNKAYRPIRLVLIAKNSGAYMKRYIKSAKKTFNCMYSNGTIDADRTTKQLTVSRITHGDYYNGADHNLIYFKDNTGEGWRYSCPTTFREMQTSFGRFCREHEGDNTFFTVSAYYIRERDDISGDMFNPRLLK